MGVNDRPRLNRLSNTLQHCQPTVGMATTSLRTLKGHARSLPCLRPRSGSSTQASPANTQQRVAVMERRGEEAGAGQDLGCPEAGEQIPENRSGIAGRAGRWRCA